MGSKTRPVRLFSIVFNEPYLTWFETACVHSLLWPKNMAALRGAIAWDLWTMPEDEARVRAIAAKIGLPLEVSLLKPYQINDGALRKRNLQTALMAELNMCRDRYAFMWLAPDSIFGDGTIASLIELGAVPGLCIALAPMRVLADGFLEAMGEGPLSNAALVKLAFERMHKGFREADATLEYSNSYESGVSWRKIGEGLYAVTHLMHSAYLMQPVMSDAKWFGDMDKFGAYDHSFPKRLVERQGQRVVGSSDAAFVVELTPSNGHAPSVMRTNPEEPDRYIQDMPHHAVNRNVVCIWRAA